MSSSRTEIWPVVTKRLRLRGCEVDDLDALWEWRRLPEVNHWLSSAPGTLSVFREHYSASDRLDSLYVIELLPDERGGAPALIGDFMLRLEDGWAQSEVAGAAENVEAELGWVLDPAYARRGFATEAMRAVIDVCFGELDLRRVHAGCFADNEPSWRLMERLGMRREEFSRKTALHRSGVWLDGMNYGLLAEEWLSPRRG